MTDLTEFKDYYALSAQLIDEMTKEDLAECARMLALHVANYRQRFGDLPQSDALSLLGVVELTEEQAALLRDGMEILTGYLGGMKAGLDDLEGPVH